MKKVLCFNCLLGACMAAASAQQTQHSYPSMAPLSQYLMADQAAEIKLARSAAPAAISDHATVMVLQPHGYVEAVKGSNGYVCIVDRAWMSAFDAPQFWNPKLRGPTCLNPQAAASILPLTLKRTVLALALHSKEGIQQGMQAAFVAKELPPLEPGAMSYMMSKQGYLDDQAGHWMSHVMFYTPAKMDWGADVAGSPVISNPQFLGDAQPINVQMITVSKWSDGTPAPSM